MLLKPSTQRIAAKQHFLCPVCRNGLYSTREFVDLHRIIPRSQGGGNTYGNLVLLHTECHKKAQNLGWSAEVLKKRLEVLNKDNSRNSA